MWNFGTAITFSCFPNLSDNIIKFILDLYLSAIFLQYHIPFHNFVLLEIEHLFLFDNPYFFKFLNFIIR